MPTLLFPGGKKTVVDGRTDHAAPQVLPPAPPAPPPAPPVAPADLISADPGNALVLGADAKLYTATGGVVALDLGTFN
jgi:hypothetical protein